MERVRAQAVKPLYREVLGTASTVLVCLPGVGGTTRYWKGPLGPLASDHRVVLVDLLGFGRSPKPWRRYTVDRHVAGVHDIVRDVAPATLVGHSFGAIVAAAYAARHPELVERLVLVATPYLRGVPGARAQYRGQGSLERWVMANIVLAAVACVLTRRVLRPLLPYLLTDLPREVVEDLIAHTWRSFTSTVWEGLYRYNAALDFVRLPAALPVLFLHGDQDATAPIEGMRRLAALHPRATVRVLEGGDHHLVVRRPDWVREAIRAFEATADHSPGPSAEERVVGTM